jgi:hypothetical protein
MARNANVSALLFQRNARQQLAACVAHTPAPKRGEAQRVHRQARAAENSVWIEQSSRGWSAVSVSRR